MSKSPGVCWRKTKEDGHEAGLKARNSTRRGGSLVERQAKQENAPAPPIPLSEQCDSSYFVQQCNSDTCSEQGLDSTAAGLSAGSFCTGEILRTSSWL